MDYLGIDKISRDEKVINKSRFITTLVPVKDAEEAGVAIKDIRREFADATHNCYAFSVEGYLRQSDDGEPQGTAGVPMLEVLKKRGCNNMLAVVTRYFGGVKLGASGLIGAYSSCVCDALDKADTFMYRKSMRLCIEVDYTLVSKVEDALARNGAEVTGRDYSDIVRYTALVPQVDADNAVKAVISATLGRAAVSSSDGGYAAYGRNK